MIRNYLIATKGGTLEIDTSATRALRDLLSGDKVPSDFSTMSYQNDNVALESTMRLLPFETMVVWGTGSRPEGTMIGFAFGGDDAVDPGKEVEAAILADRGAIVTHNHPQNAPLSVEDIAITARLNIAELRAVATDQISAIVRPEGGWALRGDPEAPISKDNPLPITVFWDETCEEARKDDKAPAFFDTDADWDAFRLAKDYAEKSPKPEGSFVITPFPPGA